MMTEPKCVSGSQLQELLEGFSPFTEDLQLKPEKDRRTVLAANANFPFELEVAGFCHACTLDGGSPIIIQFSSGALATAGRGLRAKADLVRSLRAGSRMASLIAETYARIYDPPFVALGLDHYAVPDLHEALFSVDRPPETDGRSHPSLDEVKARLREAAESACACGVRSPSREDMAIWETYLSSHQYREAVAGFMTVIKEMRPAWAMIDTEELPPVLNFAVTREIRDLVVASGSDAVLEAEYGATGQSGDDTEYRALWGDDLSNFARQVAGFVRYTDAGGISYPIGMEHAAPSDVKHEADSGKLEVVQREIHRVLGRYVPFAQHGGTGAKNVVRGLVGKDNVNTLFLVTAAQYFAAHTDKNREAISRGRKSAAGASMYLSASRSIMEATVKKLKECGTYGILGYRPKIGADETGVSIRAE